MTGHWAGGCESDQRFGRYARYFMFTLAERRHVSIVLRSGEADASDAWSKISV